jgi:hypothetical protein
MLLGYKIFYSKIITVKRNSEFLDFYGTILHLSKAVFEEIRKSKSWSLLPSPQGVTAQKTDIDIHDAVRKTQTSHFKITNINTVKCGRGDTNLPVLIMCTD